jgi:hypothetical protein
VPFFASYTPAFALQLRKKHKKASVRVVKKWPFIPVVVIQYTFTHKQYTEQHNETEYTEQNMHNNKNTKAITIRIFKHNNKNTWLGKGSSGRLCEHSTECSGSINGRQLLDHISGY